jgi:hypothetical protein
MGLAIFLFENRKDFIDQSLLKLHIKTNQQFIA